MFFTVNKASKHHSYDYIWLLINYFNEKLKFLSASSNDAQKVTKTCLEKMSTCIKAGGVWRNETNGLHKCLL